MARRKTRTLTELELEIMQIIWKHGEVTVEDIRQVFDATGKSLALPSIRTMLAILQSKGYVTRWEEGRRHVYRAKVTQEMAHKSIIKDVVERAFEGSALDLVAALVDTRMVSRGDLSEVRRLIQKAEKETRK